MEIEKKYLLLSGIVEKVDTIEKKEKERERNRDRIIIRPGLSRIDRGGKDRPMVIYKANDEFIRPRAVDSDGIH